MTDEAWSADFVRSLGVLLSGTGIEEVDERGEPIIGETLLILLNASHERVSFKLPELDPAHQWQRVFDTMDARMPAKNFKPGGRYPLQGRSVTVLKVSPPLKERRRAFAGARTAAAAGELQPLYADGPVGDEQPTDVPAEAPPQPVLTES